VRVAEPASGASLSRSDPRLADDPSGGRITPADIPAGQT
jgi:hypothetical protein